MQRCRQNTKIWCANRVFSPEKNYSEVSKAEKLLILLAARILIKLFRNFYFYHIILPYERFANARTIFPCSDDIGAFRESLVLVIRITTGLNTLRDRHGNVNKNRLFGEKLK